MLLALVLGLAAAVPAAAQLSGTVVDASGAPVADATVRLEAGRGTNRRGQDRRPMAGSSFAVTFTGSARHAGVGAPASRRSSRWWRRTVRR